MFKSAFNGFGSWFHIENLPLFRQVVATFASCLLSITGGFTFGHTAVLLPQLAADQDFPYNKAYDSWIASVSPLAMIFGSVCSGPISDAIGRRKGQLLLIVPFTLGWIIIGMARNNATIIAGRVITGLCTGAIRPVGMVYIGEVSDPKYRSTTLFCPGMAIFVGSLFCHLSGRYMSWRLASYLFMIPNILCFIIQMWLKESPLWLLSNGRTEEGVKSFEWFRGSGDAAEKELKAVMASQNKDASSSWKQFVLTKAFLKSLLTIMFICIASQMCGINTVSFYAIEMFESTFGGEIDAFMLMLAMDILRVFATLCVCFIAKRLPTKLSYLVVCFGTSLVLVGLVIVLSVKPVGLVWISLICLIAYIMIAGIMTTLGWSFITEIFPSKVRGFGSGLSSLLQFSLLFVSVKVTPTILNSYGEAAMYGTFATFTFCAALILIFMLPETQGKTLQDIENTLYKTKDTKDTCSDAA